jgi:hypothetical protein
MSKLNTRGDTFMGIETVHMIEDSRPEGYPFDITCRVVHIQGMPNISYYYDGLKAASFPDRADPKKVSNYFWNNVTTNIPARIELGDCWLPE